MNNDYLMKCPRCGDQVDADALFCKNCGVKLDQYVTVDDNKKKLFMIAGVFSFVCSALTLIFLFNILIINILHYYKIAIHDTKIMIIARLVLDVYIFIFFRKLLNDKYRFPDVNTYIVLIIIFDVITSLLNIATQFIYKYHSTHSTDLLYILYEIFFVLSPIAYGIIMIVFSVKLLHLRDNLSGFLKPFCYLMIAAAISNITPVLSNAASIRDITLVLQIFAMIFTMANYVIWGLIFLKSANRRTITVRTQKAE